METGRYRIPKVPLDQRLFVIRTAMKMNFHFTIYCIPLQGVREQFFLLPDTSFMDLDNYTKFLYIIQAEYCTAIIGKCVYKNTII